MIRTLVRLSLMSTVAVVAQMAFAAINYNVLTATIAYNNGDAETLTPNIVDDTISFSAPNPMVVGSGGDADHFAATITIIYTAESDTAVTGLNLDFSGLATNLGKVNFTELVEAWSPDGGTGGAIGSINGSFGGSGFAGGSDEPFVGDAVIDFGGEVFSYKVKKVFTLLDLDATPENSSASIDSIDQSPVPEPATMAALAIGAAGLLARRRRRKS